MDKVFVYGGAGLLALILAAVFTAIMLRLRRRRKEEQESQYWHVQNEWLKSTFDNFDVAVYGLRGAGKDVIFAHTINLQGKKHYSNIFYNSQTEVRDLKDLNVGGNEYESFINGTTHKFEPNFEENYHFFISDAGVYLGCQYNKELNQNYGEMPIHIALRRHLYDSHVHTNSQALNRPWDKIREQQGAYIHCLGVKNYGEFLIVSAITYTKYESALLCLPPPKNPDKYDILRNGEIEERWFKVPTKSLSYDTRHFRTALLQIAIKEEQENARAAIVV
ncbi:MAG: hypothetical protein FWD58_06585 [Firmicutes bacterium]|nr:hypothetical protein [Bacillota bacterium]